MLDLHLELRTHAQDVIDTVVFSTLLLFAYKWEWDDLDDVGRADGDLDVNGGPGSGVGGVNINRDQIHPEEDLIPYEMIVPSSSVGTPPPIHNFLSYDSPPLLVDGTEPHVGSGRPPILTGYLHPPPAYSTT